MNEQFNDYLASKLTETDKKLLLSILDSPEGCSCPDVHGLNEKFDDMSRMAEEIKEKPEMKRFQARLKTVCAGLLEIFEALRLQELSERLREAVEHISPTDDSVDDGSCWDTKMQELEKQVNEFKNVLKSFLKLADMGLVIERTNIVLEKEAGPYYCLTEAGFLIASAIKE